MNKLAFWILKRFKNNDFRKFFFVKSGKFYDHKKWFSSKWFFLKPFSLETVLYFNHYIFSYKRTSGEHLNKRHGLMFKHEKSWFCSKFNSSSSYIDLGPNIFLGNFMGGGGICPFTRDLTTVLIGKGLRYKVKLGPGISVKRLR